MKQDPRMWETPALDDRALDLDRAHRVTYLLDQTFRYDYSDPVEDLHHRLVVWPPARHGHQHLRARRLDVHGAATLRDVRRDARGNTVVRLRAERVERSVEFRVGALVERVHPSPGVPLPVSALTDPWLLRGTRLTAPDQRLRELAHAAERGAGGPLDLAGQICVAVHGALTYAHDVTSVRTTAAEAVADGRGVCQDYAHIMLAVCHVLALPARYVSGHLLGHGGTHAWVEVVVPDSAGAIAIPFDPCNGVPCTARYLTVAAGRDYADVRPTSGRYLGAAGGRLVATRRLAVLAAA